MSESAAPILLVLEEDEPVLWGPSAPPTPVLILDEHLDGFADESRVLLTLNSRLQVLELFVPPLPSA